MARRLTWEPPAARHDEHDDAIDMTCDIAIIGGGIAGLSVALSLPPEFNTVLVTKHVLG